MQRDETRMQMQDGQHEHGATEIDTPYRFHEAAAFKLRGLLMVPAIAVLFFWNRWEWENDLGVWSIGLSLFFLGMGLRVWAQRHLKYRLRQKRVLATSGPYAWTRNPVYIGNLLILASVCMLCELPWMIPLVCGWAVLVYHLAICFEEDRLLKRHGEGYAAYRHSVWRWWPRRPAARTPSDAGACRWMEAARVEWQCLLFPLMAMIKEFMD